MNNSASMITKDLLKHLGGVSEDQLRRAIRLGRLHPDRLSNGMFIWSPEAIAEAKEYFSKRFRQKKTGIVRGGILMKASIALANLKAWSVTNILSACGCSASLMKRRVKRYAGTNPCNQGRSTALGYFENVAVDEDGQGVLLYRNRGPLPETQMARKERRRVNGFVLTV